MVNHAGQLRLADFGFAKQIEKNQLTYTLVGTPEYLPPEILRGHGYGIACDWWSLGILIYKLLNGHGPGSFICHIFIFFIIVRSVFARYTTGHF